MQIGPVESVFQHAENEDGEVGQFLPLTRGRNHSNEYVLPDQTESSVRKSMDSHVIILWQA